MRFLRALTGRVLTCGCLLGVYETYGGRIVTTIDACGPDCRLPAHRLHEIVSEPPTAATELSAHVPDGRERSRF